MGNSKTTTILGAVFFVLAITFSFLVGRETNTGLYQLPPFPEILYQLPSLDNVSQVDQAADNSLVDLENSKIVLKDIIIDQEVSVFGETFNIVELTEDSRCPSDATCVWEGQVLVRAMLNDRLIEMKEGEAQSVGDINILLTRVNPDPVSDIEIGVDEYSFDLEFSRA